jgi:hypothetical protein
MSAQFPNVPSVPGVPAVARAGAQLQSIANGAGTALSSAQDALGHLNASDLVAAAGDLGFTVDAAQGALSVAEPIFSLGGELVGSLSGTVANASSALTALGSGDVRGAAAAINQTIDAADRAFNTITSIISPSPINALLGSGEEVNADTARQWGLFTQDGDFAAPADNVVAFENSLEARISDYPVEQGGFGSYNKVILPYDVRLMMSRGGSVEDRQDFLKAVQDAWQSTELFNVVTPECVYLDVNVIGMRRMAASDRGVGLMTLEIVLRKVRETATLTFTKTKEPSGAGQVKDGSVQAQKPADAQQYAGAGR